MGFWARFSTKRLEERVDLLAATCAKQLDVIRETHNAELKRIQEMHEKQIDLIMAVHTRFVELLKPQTPVVPTFLPKPEVPGVVVNQQGQVGIPIPTKNKVIKPTVEMAIEEAREEYFNKKASEGRLARVAMEAQLNAQ